LKCNKLTHSKKFDNTLTTTHEQPTTFLAFPSESILQSCDKGEYLSLKSGKIPPENDDKELEFKD
jgi:hypothetical protein